MSFSKSVFNKTIDKVNYDLDRMQFNTAIASMMELLNHAYKYKEDNSADEKLFGFFVYVFIVLLNPLIPHLSNELWSKSNFKDKDILIFEREGLQINLKVSDNFKGLILIFTIFTLNKCNIKLTLLRFKINI